VHGDISATVPRLPTFELPLAIDASLNPLLLIELALIHAHVIEPHPASRDQLRAPPVWERLHMAGVRVATIHFPFTYPARDQATHVISDRVVTDAIISPPTRVERTLAWFSGSAGADPDVLRQIFPQERWPQPKDALVDPVATLSHVLDSSQRMFGATRQLIADDPSLAVVLLYVPDLDTVCHAFWPYRHPEDFPDDPPAPADVAVLGPVVDKYVTYLDRSIAAVMATFPSPPDVLIVADHGEGPARGLTTLWRGWHARDAAVLAAGPDIPHHESLIDLTYYDIVPTIFELTGFLPALDLGGHSIVTTR
jgi:predicted AlkP superfamily phosphohydrolase/phosphomutase